MIESKDIVNGCRLTGILANGTVEVLKVIPHGRVIEIVYQTDRGDVGKQMILEDDMASISLAEEALPWQFDGDANLMRLVSESYRIELAHLFDPYLAVHTSSIEPLPHQISAVYEKMLPKHPLRFVLADDPGAGKTIMTGLFIKELIMRGDVQRCMIVCPGSLAEQWQEELFHKFHLRFEILTNDRIEAAITGNIFTEMNLCIARLDKLSRDEKLQERLKASDWDLVVCDEAHKMSATFFGTKINYTKRFRLGQLLASVTRHFLLLTATPHNGKDTDFRLFLSLIDPDRFEGAKRDKSALDVSDIMRRLVKEELLKFDGRPLFPERIAYTINYEMSQLEQELYEAVTDYVKNEFNRADKLSKKAKSTVGFALTSLQRRLASSPEAIYQSLRRRIKRLEDLILEAKTKQNGWQNDFDWMDDRDIDDFDELPDDEWENTEDNIASQATAAKTIQEIEAEIAILQNLMAMANAVRMSGVDRKWDELSRLLQENEHLRNEAGEHEKFIIFTEHTDTLYYLQRKIGSLLGRQDAVVVIHGKMKRDDRHLAEHQFRQDKNIRILLATDAAGEGINLQTAHLMMNYDLPWNPNRLEQRFGRIHRIGQTEVCYLWNMVADNTREGDVFKRLFEKLEEERKALGGKVFDILGKVSFNNKPLRELLVEAIRYGQDPKTKAYLNTVLDDSLDRKQLEKIIAEQALTKDIMGVADVAKIRAEMERIEARKLQPYFIESFFKEAFVKLGGRIYSREENRYELTRVPMELRNRQAYIGFSGVPVLPSYERITFHRDKVDVQGFTHAEFICPGHPLLESVVSLIQEKYGSILKQGAIFIDEQSTESDVRLLTYIEDSVQDGRILSNGKNRLVSKHVHYVELSENGTARNAGFAPYLNYRQVKEEEQEAVEKLLQEETWLQAGVEKIATDYAIEHLLPKHLREIRSQQKQILDKIEDAVRRRLTAEIQHWDFQAANLKLKEAAGKGNPNLNAANAQKRADQLHERLERRLREIAEERNIKGLPPVIIGAALVIPKLRLEMQDSASTFAQDAMSRRTMELAGMKAVMEIERSLGYTPKDVSRDNVGYDIESAVPADREEEEGSLRFIEVKARRKGSTTVTISRNEIHTALNQPERFILAIVEVDGETRHTHYIKKPFGKEPDFGVQSINYNIADLLKQGSCVLEK